MLHADSEKRMRAVQAESKLKDYINTPKLTYNESIRRNLSHGQLPQQQMEEQKIGTIRDAALALLARLDQVKRPGTTKGIRKKRISSTRYRPGTAAMKRRQRLQSGQKLRPRTHKSAKPPKGGTQSMRQFFQQQDKTKEFDYEIELLHNLLNSEYTQTKGGRENLKDAYNIILHN